MLIYWSISLLIFQNDRFVHGFSVSLEKLSAIYLPYQYHPIAYEMDENAAAVSTFDAEKEILYTVGNENLHVINMSDVTSMSVIHHMHIPNVKLTYVDFCGGYVFVAMENQDDEGEGFVHVYKRYEEVTEQLERIVSITVGPTPDMVLPTQDCQKLVVVIEANPYESSNKGGYLDPEGGVTIIKFHDLSSGIYEMKALNFSAFNDQIDNLENDGVRFVYRENGNMFSNDVEPEYVTFNKDETKAYVSLQENNAVAVVDLVSEEITNVYGLGFKDWRQFEIDPSDNDGGIHLQSWPVYGIYQPDAIKCITIGDDDYIITANEGETHTVGSFDDDTRVKSITLSSIFESNSTRRGEIQGNDQLGRLRISKINGYNVSTGMYDALYTFGGRSFSIRRADDLSLVYDSGSSISNNTARLYPELFNMDVDKGDTAIGEADSYSDYMGPSPETVEIAKFGNYTLLIIGNEKPGTLGLYSIDESKPRIEPMFEGMYHDIRRLDAKWEYLIGGHDISMIDPEDIRYIPGEDSPNGKPLLVVTGVVSGSVTIMQINVELDESTSIGTNPTKTPTATMTMTSSIPNVITGGGLISETAYLVTIGILAGVLVVGSSALLAYLFVARDLKRSLCCLGTVAAMPSRTVHSKSPRDGAKEI